MPTYYINLTKRRNVIIQVEAISKYAALEEVQTNIESYYKELDEAQEFVECSILTPDREIVKIGRPRVTADTIPRVFHSYYPLYKNGDINVSDFARLCSLSRPTIYKYLKLIGDTTPNRKNKEDAEDAE